jgi:hypothetical protein
MTAALNTLAAQQIHYAGVRARLMNLPVTKPELPRARVRMVVPANLGELLASQDTVPLDMYAPGSWMFLVKLAALRHGQRVKDILGPSRSKPVVKARHEAMYLMFCHTTYSLNRIGKKFGRDHSTVVACLAKYPRFDRQQMHGVHFTEYPRPPMAQRAVEAAT